MRLSEAFDYANRKFAPIPRDCRIIYTHNNQSELKNFRRALKRIERRIAKSVKVKKYAE